MASERVFVVPPDADGLRLDRFLAARMARLTRSRIARILRADDGTVRLEPPRPVRPATSLRVGDRVILRRPDESDGTEAPLIILHRDPFAVVVDKPAGVLVQPTARVFAASLTHRLAAMAEPGEHLEPVHRLDRETSGALMASRVREAVPALRGMFAAGGAVEKLYVALAHDPHGRWQVGHPVRLTHPLGLDPDALVRVRMGRGAQPSRTDVTVLQRLDEHALLACRLLTGRQHQIRVHLALEGTPIVGDKLYQMGDAFFMAICERPDDPELLEQLPAPRMALHAARIGWRCPFTQEHHQVDAPLPDDFPRVGADRMPWTSLE